MEEKITLNLFYIALLSAILAALLSGIIFFDAFRTQVTEDLERQGKLAAAAYEEYGSMRALDMLSDESFRITLIDSDGTVLYESNTDAAAMANHLDRAEVQSALRNGAGSSRRTSDTLGTDDYYYATLLNDGTVLRVSCSVSNIYQFYGKAIPYLIIMILVLMVLAVISAVLLTRRMLVPIKRLPEHLDDPSLTEDPDRLYPELKPFVLEIQRQRIDRDSIRQEFTANVSHELKTPLTSISGYAEMIESGMAREGDIQRFAGTIRKEAARMLSLISDIIRLSQLDETQSVQNWETVDLKKLAEECAETLLPTADKQGIALRVDGEETLIHGDKTILWELCYNLMDNAIRYNRVHGSVNVILHKNTLTVNDTGIGIPPEHQDRIFERFYRVDKSHSRQTGGTGLGLSIVKHAAEHHNAKLTLSSTPGVGTVISVEFPHT